MYTLRKTPRSSFMVGTGDATLTIAPTPGYVPVSQQPTAVIGQPPPPVAPVKQPNYLLYALAGGAALVYFLVFRKKER